MAVGILMTKPKQSSVCKGYRFLPEILAYAGWAYVRAPKSLRDVEGFLAAHGLVVNCEPIRA